MVATRLPDVTPEHTIGLLAARTGATQGAPPGAVRHAIQSMVALLEGEEEDLSTIACDFGRAGSFAEKVYAIARAVPPGATSTYGAIASELGDKSFARRVGQALGRNPVPIIVPCHRIIGADGKLVGFSADGGVEMKLRMLEIEGAQIGSTPGLFDNLPLATRPQR
ncbi:MAG: MGMT family protein [Pseudomonadota bacterium]